MGKWKYGNPPNQTLVEVELDRKLIKVSAIYGRDGQLPHWESDDGRTLWPVEKFTRWRRVNT